MAVSMSHTQAVLAMYGNDVMVTWAGPAVIDLAMVAAGAALLAIHAPHKRTTRRRKARGTATRKATVPATAPQLAVA